MIRRPPRSTQSRSSAASDVYKRQGRRHLSSCTPKGRDPQTALPESLRACSGRADGGSDTSGNPPAVCRIGASQGQRTHDHLHISPAGRGPDLERSRDRDAAWQGRRYVHCVRTHERGSGSADGCLLYTSDAADDLLCVDLGGRRIIKKKKKKNKKP